MLKRDENCPRRFLSAAAPVARYFPKLCVGDIQNIRKCIKFYPKGDSNAIDREKMLGGRTD